MIQAESSIVIKIGNKCKGVTIAVLTIQQWLPSMNQELLEVNTQDYFSMQLVAIAAQETILNIIYWMFIHQEVNY